MTADFDKEALIGVFVTESAQGLQKVWAGLYPEDGRIPTASDLQPYYIVAHTLRGAAGLYGFPGVAALAEILETLLEKPIESESVDWPEVVGMLRDLTGTLQAQIEKIRLEGTEDVAGCEAWTARFARLLESCYAPGERSSSSNSRLADVLPESYLSPDLDPEILSYFIPEAEEYLDSIEAFMLRLEKQPDDAELIQQLFRTAHTLKGSAYTVGFKSIGDLTHHLEDIMGAIRDGRLSVTSTLTDIVFKTMDVIRLLMRRDPRSLNIVRRDFAHVRDQLKRVGERGLAEGGELAFDGEIAMPAKQTPALVPSLEPDSGEKPEPREVDQGVEKESATEREEGAVIRVSRDRLERLLNLVGELVTSRGRLEQRLIVLEELSKQVLVCKNRMQESVRTFEEKHAFTLPVLVAPAPPLAGSLPLPQLAGFPGLDDLGSLEFDQYDDFNILARRIAEVSADVAESMSQLSASIRKAREDMGQLQRLTAAIRDEIARARMVPVGTPLTRFRRAVREMAKATGKEVTLNISGANTEVDTGVVERLVDPLIHLIRNAVFHGIETPGVRLARGKPTVGTVSLHAAHRGNSLIIEVEDDGAGLDLEKIKGRAVTLGLLRPELASTLSEAEAIKMIFLPGFSTADDVGDQAGRGVGLDVVKRALDAMSGQIDVETEPGVGTKFTLSLPLTLLISTALLVRLGSERYAIPLPSIREVVGPRPGAIQDISGRPVLQTGDEAIEVQSLARLLGVASSVADGSAPVVIVRTATGVVGLSVDELLGRHEIVIKPLGGLKLFSHSCFSGATIDREGAVILVLDVGRLMSGRLVRAGMPVPLQALPATSMTVGESKSPAEEQGSRILLIDDSLSVRKFVGRMLKGAGYDVETAVDGEEGLRKASMGAYRLIITDLEMPKVNGYEVIQALRQRPQTTHTPILVMTTRAGAKHRQMALKIGATGYIAKPVEERSFLRQVAQWTGGASEHRSDDGQVCETIDDQRS